MKDYYLFPEQGEPIKISEDRNLGIKINASIFNKMDFLDQLKKLISYIEKYKEE